MEESLSEIFPGYDLKYKGIRQRHNLPIPHPRKDHIGEVNDCRVGLGVPVAGEPIVGCCWQGCDGQGMNTKSAGHSGSHGLRGFNWISFPIRGLRSHLLRLNIYPIPLVRV